MALTRKASAVTSYSLLAFIVFLAWKDVSSCRISSTLSLTGKVGKDIIFQFNTTRNNSILAVKFGLDGHKRYPVPKFITVKNLKGTLVITYAQDDLNNKAADYKGRVTFVGNLEKGQAWFRLSNISPTDAKVYLASIREHGDNDYRKTKRFKLTVSKTEIISPSESSEERFIAFEGIVVKQGKSHSIVDEESKSTVLAAIVNAYWNASMISEIEIKYIKEEKLEESKVNETFAVKSGFNITFTEPINRTYAYSFLQEAQQNNQLRGYNITCFENIDPKLPEKASDLVKIIVGVVVGILIIVAAGFLFRHFYKKSTSRSGVRPSNQDVLPKTSESSPPAVPP